MQSNPNSITNLFYNFPQNIVRIFKPAHLLWLAFGIVITYVCVRSGFDWKYFLFFHGTTAFNYLFPAAIVGFFVPFFTPLILMFAGAIKRNGRLLNTAYAIGQAAIIGVLLAAFFKALSGRPGPPLRILNPQDISQVFRIGILRGGVFWGWPSSHTTVSVAVSMCMVALYPKNKFIVIVSAIYALYIGIGVSVSIHWFSDFVMGAILGSIIGLTVGGSFKQRILPHDKK